MKKGKIKLKRSAAITRQKSSLGYDYYDTKDEWTLE
jgi:hypothetical protein